jgi:hypothetical protein
MLSHAEAATKVLRNEPINEQALWDNRSDEAGQRYYALQYAIARGTMLAEVPQLLKAVIKSAQWKHWTWAGKLYDAPSLGEYITRKPPHGLGATLEIAEPWVRDDPDAYSTFVTETTGKWGGDRTIKSDNITLATGRGTSRAYTVRRLREQRGDLYQLVLEGKLSVNAAATKAGWRTKPPLLKQIKKLWETLSKEEKTEFLEWAQVTQSSAV